MRFRLLHLLAVVTLFAVFLGVGLNTGVLHRDGIWTVESIEIQSGGGSWSSTWQEWNEQTNGFGGTFIDYVGVLRDGDRTRRVYFASNLDYLAEIEPPGLPQPGDPFVFTGTPIPAMVGSPVLPSGPTYYAIEDKTLVLAAEKDDGYPSFYNVGIALVFSVLIVVLCVLSRKFMSWMIARLKRSLKEERTS